MQRRLMAATAHVSLSSVHHATPDPPLWDQLDPELAHHKGK